MRGGDTVKKIKLDGFKEVPNTNGDYLVHPSGKVYSKLSRKVLVHTSRENRSYTVSMRYVGEKSKPVSISRVLAETFIPNPDNCRYVIHKDNDPRNLSLENLEWSDRKPKRDGGKYIRGYENLYKIYPNGNVYSMRRRKLMKPTTLPNDTIYITLTNSDGIPKQYLLATLLYEHFIAPLRSGERVNYKDGDRLNIALQNLKAEWI